MENGSFMGGTVNRRVDKGMGGKMEGGLQRRKEAGWLSGQSNG